MSLPIWKLGSLAVKSVSKSIAGKLKQQAAIHPRFRQTIVNVAQKNHRISTQIQRRIYGHGTDASIRPLNEEKAVQYAVDLMGEIIVFTVAGVVLTLEVYRSANSEARKEQQWKKQVEELKQVSDGVAKDLKSLWPRLEEVEKPYRGRGLAGILDFKEGKAENRKTEKAA